MTSHFARSVLQFEERRAEILRELASINDRLTAVAKILDALVRSRNGHVEQKSISKRSWFARNEARALLRDLARRPKDQAQLVRELAKRKKYEGQLTPQEWKRFEGAVFMAIAHAIRSGHLKRRRDGSVVAK